MQAYFVTIEQKVSRQVRVAAHDEKAATYAVRRSFKGAQVVEVSFAADPDPADAARLLRALMAQTYLEYQDNTLTLIDWILLAAAENAGPTGPANRKLAIAGIRVNTFRSGHPANVVISAPGSIPTLGMMLDACGYRTVDLVATLICLPGARRVNCTLAGQKARGVSLPQSILTDILQVPS